MNASDSLTSITPAGPREALLTAALEVFCSQGFQAARIGDIAQLAGIGKGSVYLHFANKEQLFEAVIDESVGSRLNQAEALVNEYSGPATALLSTMLRNDLIDFWDSPSSAVYKLIIAEAQRFPELAAKYHSSITKRARKLIETVLQMGIDQGEYREIDVAYTARLILSALDNELVQAHAFAVHAKEPFDAQRFIDALVEVLINGIRLQARATEPRGYSL